MMNSNKAVTLISLVITIIITITLAGIALYYTTKNLDKAEEMAFKTEMRNIEEVVLRQKTRLYKGEFSTNSAYLVTSKILGKYNGVLSQEVVNAIEDANENASDDYKFYYLTPSNYKEQIKDDVEIRNLTRNYIVNYGLGTVIAVQNNKMYISGELTIDY